MNYVEENALRDFIRGQLEAANIELERCSGDGEAEGHPQGMVDAYNVVLEYLDKPSIANGIEAWLIYKGNTLSVTHARYMKEDDAKAEVERLEKIRAERNKQIDERPAKGHGSAFMNMKDDKEWSYKRHVFPV